MWLWLQTNGVRALASELTSRRELRALRVGETLKGALHMSGVSLHRTQTEGKGVSMTWQTFQKSLALGVSDTDDDNGVARAPYMYVLSLPLYTMGTGTTTWVQLCMLQKLRDLEIVHEKQILRKPFQKSSLMLL